LHGRLECHAVGRRRVEIADRAEVGDHVPHPVALSQLGRDRTVIGPLLNDGEARDFLASLRWHGSQDHPAVHASRQLEHDTVMFVEEAANQCAQPGRVRLDERLRGAARAKVDVPQFRVSHRFESPRAQSPHVCDGHLRDADKGRVLVEVEAHHPVHGEGLDVELAADLSRDFPRGGAEHRPAVVLRAVDVAEPHVVGRDRGAVAVDEHGGERGAQPFQADARTQASLELGNACRAAVLVDHAPAQQGEAGGRAPQFQRLSRGRDDQRMVGATHRTPRSRWV
jgi:hypothetical protein